MTQYEGYFPIPQQIQDVTANKIKLLDEYVLFQSDEYQYIALIHDMVTDETKQIIFYQDPENQTFNSYETEGSWEYTVYNEVYCYSNVGLGSALDLPVMDGVQAHASVVFTVVLMLLVVFKSSLFPFHKKK